MVQKHIHTWGCIPIDDFHFLCWAVRSGKQSEQNSQTVPYLYCGKQSSLDGEQAIFCMYALITFVKPHINEDLSASFKLGLAASPLWACFTACSSTNSEDDLQMRHCQKKGVRFASCSVQ